MNVSHDLPTHFVLGALQRHLLYSSRYSPPPMFLQEALLPIWLYVNGLVTNGQNNPSHLGTLIPQTKYTFNHATTSVVCGQSMRVCTVMRAQE